MFTKRSYTLKPVAESCREKGQWNWGAFKQIAIIVSKNDAMTQAENQ